MSDEKVFFNGYALLIGVGHYKDEKLSVPATAQDAEDVANVLLDSNLCAYPQNHVEILKNELATGANILAKLATLREQVQEKTDPTVIIFFSGHGWLEGEYYFLPYETEILKSNGKLQVKLETALANKDFLEGVRQIHAQRLVILFNTCFAGAAGTSLSPEVEQASRFAPIPLSLYDPLVQGSGRVIFSSSKPEEKSWIKPGATNSLFVTHLLAGFKDQRIRSSGNMLGVFDLFTYLSEAVPIDAESIGVIQTPIFHAYNTTRNFPIALLARDKWPTAQSTATQSPHRKGGSRAHGVKDKKPTAPPTTIQDISAQGKVQYSTATIRQLLTEALSDQKINELSMDYFREVFEQFASGMTKEQKIQSLIEYCNRQNLFPTLLELVKRTNTEKYKEYESELIVALPQRQRVSSLSIGVPTVSPNVSQYDSVEIFKRKNFKQRLSDFIDEVPKAQRKLKSIYRSFERYIPPGKCDAASMGVARACSPIEQFEQFFKQSVNLPSVVIPERYGLMSALFKSRDNLILVAKFIDEFCNQHGDAFDQPRGAREEIRNLLNSHIHLLDLALDEAKRLLVVLDG